MMIFAVLQDMPTVRSSRNANIAHGFPYPINGIEHVIAFLAVGFLAARYDDRRIWAQPATFVPMFAAGLSLGMLNTNTSVGLIEFPVLISLAVSVLLVISGRCLPLAMAVPLFAGFALVHGFAHGIQISSEVSAIRYSREVATAVAILLLVGMAPGTAARLL